MEKAIKEAIKNIGINELIKYAYNLMENSDENEFMCWKLYSNNLYDYYLAIGWKELDDPSSEKYDDMDYRNDDYCITTKIGITESGKIVKNYDDFNSPINSKFCENPLEYKAWNEKQLTFNFELFIGKESPINCITSV